MLFTKCIHGEAYLEACSEHKPVADRNDDDVRDNRGGDTTSEEVLDLKIALACSLIFHHDGSYDILESAELNSSKLTYSY